MARRKHQFLDDGDDSDSAGSSDDRPLNVPGFEDVDADLQEERELFENPYSRKKRRKTNGRDDATYGVFADDSEDEGFGTRKKPTAKRSDWAKAPSFVSGNKFELNQTLDEAKSESDNMQPEEEEKIDAEDVEEEDAEQDDSSDSSADESSDPKPLTPESDAGQENTLMPKPRFGGLGFGKSSTSDTPSDAATTIPTGFGKGGIGSGNGGIGSGKGGIGSSRAKMDTAEPTTDLPTAFGSRPQRAFVRDESPSNSSPRPAAPLSAAEKLHFNKLQGSFGARMLAKMGWETGTGLGAEGTGIVAPVETKLRPKNVGIAYKGFKERTAQAKAEAKRRGEVVSDDEVEDTGRRKKGTGKAKKEQEVKKDAWKKPKKTRTKIQHKTYEEIIAESSVEAPPPGIGKIIDATGATLREVSSLADVSIASWTPTSDSMRIPEVRHNLRLIVDASKGDLDGLAREARAIEDRKKWIHDEDVRLRKKLADEAELIRRLQGVHLIVDDINTKAKEMDSSDYEPDLSIFSGSIDKLLQEYPQEFNKYRLDEVVVGAISPSLRRMMSAWQPLQDPTAFTALLERWKLALKTTEKVEQRSETEIDIYGKLTITIRKAARPDTPMTPFDSFLWTVWMPKVRSSINNQWSPLQPQQAIQLFEAWSNIIPAFIRDNMLDQLILPKVSSTVANWNLKKDGVPLHSIVFPWLPHVGLRFDELMDDAKRKLKSMMRSWSPADGVPKDLMVWKDVFSSAEWENLFLKYVVPKLGALLREDFAVNPRDQKMDPLEKVLLWESIIRPSVFGQLLEMELFPKWLDVLYIWLIQPSPSFEEIAQWYSFWKGFLPTTVVNLSAVQEGFNRGLQMMSKAMELGPDRTSKLPRPEHKRSSESRSGSPSAVVKDSPAPRPRPSRTHEITFRSIVEDYVSEHNLLFMPAGKVHEKSRIPLFRVSKAVDGKGGLLVYLLDDAVWAMDGDADEYRAISLKDMVLRATKGHG